MTIRTIDTTAVPDLSTAVGGHRAILKALCRHDGETAVRLLSMQLLGGERLVLDAIKRAREARQDSCAPPTFILTGERDGIR